MGGEAEQSMFKIDLNDYVVYSALEETIGLQMKLKKSELLQALKADLKEAERMQRDWFTKRETWLSETYGQPYGNEEDGKSKIVS